MTIAVCLFTIFALLRCTVESKTIYATAGRGRQYIKTNSSSLWEIDVANETAVEIGDIMVITPFGDMGPVRVNGLAYDWERSRLLAHTSTNSENYPNSLLTINTVTAEATPLGAVFQSGGTGHLNFCPDGTLYVYRRSNFGLAAIIQIDPETAEVLRVVEDDEYLNGYPQHVVCFENYIFLEDTSTRFDLDHPENSTRFANSICRSGVHGSLDPDDATIMYAPEYFSGFTGTYYVCNFTDGSVIKSFDTFANQIHTTTVAEPDVCSEFTVCESFGGMKRYSVSRGERGGCRCVLPEAARLLFRFGFSCGCD